MIILIVSPTNIYILLKKNIYIYIYIITQFFFYNYYDKTNYDY